MDIERTERRISGRRLAAWKVLRRVTSRRLTRLTQEVDPEGRGVSYDHVSKICQGVEAGPRATELLLAAVGPYDADFVLEPPDDQAPLPSAPVDLDALVAHLASTHRPEAIVLAAEKREAARATSTAPAGEGADGNVRASKE